MKYDATSMPAVYDRGRQLGPDVLALWMDTIRSRTGPAPISTILDLGCGTGRFSASLAHTWNARVLGIDPSRQMLARALAKRDGARVAYAAGYGERLPLPGDSVDLVFMSMVYHHLANPRWAAQECRRVLRNGGHAVVRTGTRDRIAEYPAMAFFPGSIALLEARLPAADRVQQVFAGAGFASLSADVVTQQVAQNYGELAERTSLGADSILASLSVAEFQAGIRALRDHAESTGDSPVIEPIDLFVFRVA